MTQNMQNEKKEITAFEVVKTVLASLTDDMQKNCLQALLKAAEEGVVMPVAYVADLLKCSRAQVYDTVRSIVSNLTEEQRESVYELL